MNKKIIVEDSLKEHIEFLQQSGYQVEKLNDFEDPHQVQSFDYDAVVISSSDDLPMDATSLRTGAPVVDAKNKTPEELFNILRGRY